MVENILERKRIFIIEDDMINLAIFSVCLRKRGASIIEDAFAYGNSQGIVQHILDFMPVDLIILDIFLRRGVNGYDVYKAIRAEPRITRLPVIEITSLDPEKEIPKAKSMGLDGFISKPVDVLEFPNQIRRALNGEKIWIVSR